MIPENLKEIALKIEAAEKVRANSQEAILAYCKDKSFDLDERFVYWEKYCNKKDGGYVMRKKDVNSPLLGYFIQKANEYSERREDIDYDTLLGLVDDFDNDDLEQLPNLKRELLIDSILEDKKLNLEEDSDDWDIIVDKVTLLLKEAILQENFGSYRFDW